MNDLFSEMHRRLKQRQKLVLARIIKHAGSTPRTTGTKCIITEDGTLIGTIGGGLLEYEVMEKAREVFTSEKTAILHFRLAGEALQNSEMICGGTADVFLEPVLPENRFMVDLFQRTDDLLSSGGTGTLYTKIEEGIDGRDETFRMLVSADGQKTGLIPGFNTPASHKLGVIQTMPDGTSVFADPVEPGNILYVFGAGHVSLYVSRIAALVGFRVVVIDDRKDFANAKRFPEAEEILVVPFTKAFDRVSMTPSAYIVIMTRGHAHDRDVLEQVLKMEQVLKKSCAYVGMIGSRRKRDKIYTYLMETGIPEETIKKVYSPIGLDINAETPEEIAVSILAELIKVKASKSESLKIIK